MKRTLTKFAGIACFAVALAGCGSLEPYDGIKRPPKNQIDVYEAGKTPVKPYKVIMSFSAEGGIGDEANKHRDFVEQAKKLGADAIILKPTQSRCGMANCRRCSL
jgi:hypothetical protein